MKRLVAAALLVLPLAVPVPGTAQTRELPDFTQIVEAQGATVVNISTTQSRQRRSQSQAPQLDEDDLPELFRRFIPRGPQVPRGEQEGPQSLGSGFIISSDGYILTNAHVVDAADEITVKTSDKREFKAKVIGADKRTDIALIKVEASNLPAVRMGDAGKLKVGEWVLAIGSPFGFENSVTAGIVSAKGRSLPQENFVPFIQTDVAINPGNSGGPLFNLRGEVVGINSQIYSRTGGYMGVAFAIPIDVAMDIQQQLRTAGRVSRGRIGVVIQEVSKELADSFGLQRAAGALVNGVEKGGPAEKAGVKTGDIILKFDGKPVGASSDLPRIVGSTKPGASVAMQVWREGQTRDVQVTVGEIPDDRVASVERRGAERKPEVVANRLGLVVSDLSEDRKRDGKVQGGVVVDEVRGAPRADIRPGDVITALTAKGQTTELKSADQFNKLLAQIDKSTTLTLRIRRGDNNIFATVRGETAGG
jgi:serine protease Do